MERKRFLAVVMTVMMVISMIPSMVFAAAPSGELGGKLKIKGLAAVGVVLSADYAKVTPEEVTDDAFSLCATAAARTGLGSWPCDLTPYSR